MHNTFASIVTPATAVLVFMGVLIVSLLISGFCTPNKFDHTRTKIFITCLAGFGVIITFLFYYSVVTLQQAQQRQSIIAMTSNINKLLLKGVIDQISGDEVPHFTSSLYPLLNIKVEQDDDTVEHQLLIFKLSYKIFSLWQELIIALPFVDIEPLSFLSNFLQRANSELLYKQWQLSKLDFNQETQDFGDLLFRYALDIKTQTVESYICEAKKILKDPIYIKIMTD